MGKTYLLSFKDNPSVALRQLHTCLHVYTREPVNDTTFHLKTVMFYILINMGYHEKIWIWNKAPLCKGSWISEGKTEGL